MQQSLLPQNDLKLVELSEEATIMPSKTFYIDFENKKIVGMVDDKKAIEQSILLALSTPRYKYLILSWNYGEEVNKLVGKSKDLARAELPRLIKECLLIDDRITGIEEMKIIDIDEGIRVTFIAITTHGEIPIEKEVNI